MLTRSSSEPKPGGAESDPSRIHAVPGYLQQTYWWAYIHPRAVRFFERQWLVNVILWGNFNRLRNAALDALGKQISGRTLQVACVYGNFTATLAGRIAPGASLDVVDVLPIQLQNLRRKIPASAPVTLHLNDSTALGFPDATVDQAVLFFLLHEQPADTRTRTLREALRVVKPGGKLVVVDYHRPGWWHPLRYLFEPVLRLLEPYAIDLWNHELTEWLPAGFPADHMQKQNFYGGLYQRLIITVPAGA
ncbi:MAG: methyltransferase [Betaproteobacteria bacterium RIFCSPLOWO2_02_FULL_64_12]|nr:MAG: methyltransferase [Betaproteobacteria bacterium RIFCSPLOWO2_02_FULL_64_12]